MMGADEHHCERDELEGPGTENELETNLLESTGQILERSGTAVDNRLKPTTNPIPSHDEMIARVQTLITRLRDRAEETERLRRLPDSTMAELR